MANYELALTAGEIDIALQKAHSPTTSITNTAASDPSLVTSGAVKAAIDNISGGNTLTVDSFATTALETSTDTLTDTDTAIPTSKAVVDYVASSSTPNNRDIIKIFPSDFGSAFYSGLLTSNYDNESATYDIPQGYKVAAVFMYIYSSTFHSRYQIKIYHENINSGTSTLVGNSGYNYKDPAGIVGINVNPDVQATNLNCLRIKFDRWYLAQYFYGGYIQLSK